ncbi:5'-3' exonuclease PLD3-like isoform X2 [Zophobas morio]|uniref:5'-3' exonuclease PLD3-like isoform X2 n=1 Tax=Zophobas morio TaxID=2755281 RepID=UPI003083CB34
MPHFWDYFGRSPPKQRNLQDGLFQIASQTCNLLVQVNNTNNISYGNGSTNIHLNDICVPISRPEAPILQSETDREQLLVLIPSRNKVSKFKPTGLGKRLSTVLEDHAANHDEDNHLWGHGYTQSECDGSPIRKWGQKNKWCRPSCIPISLICILIFLVVLLPLLDHATERALEELNRAVPASCINTCSLSLVESIPEGVTFNSSVKHPSTFETWFNLILSAESTIEIASFYWTLRQSEVYPDPSSVKGEIIFQSLLKAGTDRKISIKIAQNAPTQNNPNVDTEVLVKRKAAQVRSLNFAKLMGGGVLHTKFWIIDRKHVYVGSANMDWRSLTQVKELGLVINNCTCLAEDLGKVFDVYWKLGEDGARIPDQWPANLSTHINKDTPMNLTLNNETFQTYLSSSPPPFNPSGRTNDIDALLNVIQHAETFIYIAVMDYFPLTIYTPKIKFWPKIDDALKTAAIEHHVKVKMLISWWNHSRPSEDNFLKSIASINQAYPRVSIEVRRFIVPSDKEQEKIPFARVNHNKYMVTDNTVYIGTSNWSGDYFTDTAGVSFVLHDPMFDRNVTQTTLRSELQAVFERDWNSNLSYPLKM